jgi:tetratricopeptide (TPR) repeat protein
MPRTPGVPRGVADAIARGLRPDPGKRFASMDELADELERCVRREQRRTSIAVGIALVFAALIGLLGVLADVDPPPCHVRAPSMALRVDDRAVEASLAAYARSLQRADAHACDVPDDERRAAVQRCLDHRREAMRTLVASIGDARDVSLARAAVRDLPPIDACSRRDAAAVHLEAHAQRHLDGELLPAIVLQSLGRYDEALDRVESLRRRRGSTGTTEVIRAELLDQVGRSEEAAEAMEATFFDAVEAHDARTSAAAAMALVGLSYEHARFDEALRWSEHARSQLDSLEPVPPSRRIAWLHNTAMAHFWAGDIERARTLLTEANAWLAEESLVTEIDASVHGSHATVLLFAGEAALALEEHAREIEIRHAVNGASDPDLVGAHLNEGNTLQTLGRSHDALEAFATAEALALQHEHHDMDAVAATLSRVRMEAHFDPRPSLAFEARRAVERLAEAPPAHRAAAAVVAGEVIRTVEGCEAAIDPLTTAIADLEHAVGAQHHAVGSSYAELGIALRDCGHDAEARRVFGRALEILRAALPPDHPWIEEVTAEIEPNEE